MRGMSETRGSGERRVTGEVRARRGDAGQVGQRDSCHADVPEGRWLGSVLKEGAAALLPAVRSVRGSAIGQARDPLAGPTIVGAAGGDKGRGSRP